MFRKPCGLDFTLAARFYEIIKRHPAENGRMSFLCAFFDFGAGIVMRDDLAVGQALSRVIIRAVLAHADAVAVAVYGEAERAVLIVYRKRGTAQTQ